MSLLAQDERLTRRVGTITLVMLAATIAFFVFVKDRIELGSPIRIRVYFHHSAGLVAKTSLVVGGSAVAARGIAVAAQDPNAAGVAGRRFRAYVRCGRFL